ncbi:MAG: protein-tyrosine kinase, partial [Gammaproteobacteria bacterium]
MSIIEKAIDRLTEPGPGELREIREVEEVGAHDNEAQLASLLPDMDDVAIIDVDDAHVPADIEAPMSNAVTTAKVATSAASAMAFSAAAARRAAPSSPKKRGMHTSREVELDLAMLKASGIVTPELENTVLAEQYRLIKRPLLMQVEAENNTNSRANLIMVGSAIPGEGKTHTAINLAMSIAMERDRTVLLVDGDVAKADISRTLGFKGDEGLTDYLVRGDADLSRYLVRTNVPKLQVLPSGQRHPNLT